tara:strand:+ start:1593 stop:2630 length:1038 start_codon:yes stop_codon:yes gene_type:complete
MDTILDEDLFISVVMPVFNCQDYIRESVDSILNQTFTKFEFLIIDDCSTDNTVKIIEEYSDPRIKILKNIKNSGISRSLNHGISLAKGKYIARMDGDDVSLPNRFDKQLEFLENNSEVILCGSGFRVIGKNSETYFSEEHEDIKLALLKRNCIAHPSVMMRKSSLLKLETIYNSSMEPAEDYDLWVRLLPIGKLYNLNEVLLNYRVHDLQVSEKNRTRQLSQAFEAKFKLLEYLECTFDSEEKHLFGRMIQNVKNINFKELKNSLTLKNKLIKSNSNTFFNQNLFTEYLSSLENENFKNYFIRRKQFSPVVVIQFYSIVYKSNFDLSILDQIKFIVKSLIFYKRK